MKARATLVWAVLVLLVGVVLAVAQPGDLGNDDEHPDVALAEAVVLRLEDFPADQGWQLRRADEDTATDATPPEGCAVHAAALAAGEADTLPGERAGAESPAFERGDLGPDGANPPVVVNAFVTVFDAPSAAAQPFALFRDTSGGQCLVAAVEDSLNQSTGDGQSGPAVTLSNLTVAAVTPPALGNDSLLLRLSGSLGVPTVIELPFQFDLHLVQAGRLLLGLVVFSFNAPPGDDLAPALLQGMLNRAA